MLSSKFADAGFGDVEVLGDKWVEMEEALRAEEGSDGATQPLNNRYGSLDCDEGSDEAEEVIYSDEVDADFYGLGGENL